jgi:hypothetical protein
MSGVEWQSVCKYQHDGTWYSVTVKTTDGTWEAYLKRDGCFDLIEAGGHEDAFSVHLCDGLASLDELILRLQNLRALAVRELGESCDAWDPTLAAESVL